MSAGVRVTVVPSEGEAELCAACFGRRASAVLYRDERVRRQRSRRWRMARGARRCRRRGSGSHSAGRHQVGLASGDNPERWPRPVRSILLPSNGDGDRRHGTRSRGTFCPLAPSPVCFRSARGCVSASCRVRCGERLVVPEQRRRSVPTSAPQVVKEGEWDGQPWQLIAYPSATHGLCSRSHRRTQAPPARAER